MGQVVGLLDDRTGVGVSVGGWFDAGRTMKVRDSLALSAPESLEDPSETSRETVALPEKPSRAWTSTEPSPLAAAWSMPERQASHGKAGAEAVSSAQVRGLFILSTSRRATRSQCPAARAVSNAMILAANSSASAPSRSGSPASSSMRAMCAV